MNGLQKWLQFFERISCFYIHRFMNPLWNNQYRNHLNNLQDSICLFLAGYAFERNLNPQTRNRWAQIAVQSVQQAFNQHNGRWNSQIISQVWNTFNNQISKSNAKANPLAPRGTPCGGNRSTNQLSFLEAINLVPTIINSSFTEFIRQQISHGNFLLVYGYLTQINGINDKIASFFLRDFLEVFQIEIYPDEREILAQPVDTHVREVINKLNNLLKLGLPLVKDLEFKVFIVSNARRFRLNPRKINMGMWYFRSQVLNGGRVQFPTLNKALNLCNNHRRTLPVNIRNVCQC